MSMASRVWVGNKWQERIQDSLEDDDINDATFRVLDKNGRETEIKCSRVILSLASPVFRKLFFGSLKAKDGERVDIVDGTAETVEDAVHFIYNEKHFEKHIKVNSSESLKDLLDLAYFGHKYEITSLTNYTHFVVCNNIVIDIGNVIDVLQDIQAYKQTLESEYFILQTMCYNFLDSNLQSIYFKNGLNDAPEVFFLRTIFFYRIWDFFR